MPPAFDDLVKPKPQPAPAKAAPKPAVTFRRFDDSVASRNAVFDAVKQAYAAKVVEDDGHRLEFADVDYDQRRDYRKRDERDAVLGRKRLYQVLKGRMRVIDKATGAVVSEDAKPRVLAHVPHMTSHGTFIHNGTEYVVTNQQRLKSGAYTRHRSSGDIATQFNVDKGTGSGFSVSLDPETGVFRAEAGQSTTKLYPILKDLGIDDATLEKAWGRDLFNANKAADDKSTRASTFKFLSKIAKQSDLKTANQENAAEVLKTVLGKMGVDDKVMAKTLGRSVKNLGPDDVFAATKKLLAVNRGEQEPDDRDALPFQSFHSAEDFFKEHVDKDSGKMLRQALWKAKTKGLSAIPPGYFSKQLQGVLLGSGVAASLAEINPIEILDQRYKITRLGEGGISDPQVVSRDARNIHDSHFGFIDPVRAPECYDDKTEVMTRRGWVLWPEVTADDEFAVLIDGRLEYSRAAALQVHDYTGTMHFGANKYFGYCVTPNHRMWVKPAPIKRIGYSPGMRIESPEQVEKAGVRLFMASGFAPMRGDDSLETFTLPPVAVTIKRPPRHGEPPVGAAMNKPTPPILIGDWLEFLGWYLSEGSTYYSEKRGNYSSQISQCISANPDNVEFIKQLLTRLPFAWSYSAKARAFHIPGKQLSSYLRGFGKSDDKYIPDYVFRAPIEARERFFFAMLLGDGRRHRTGDTRTFCTASKRMAADFARLAFELGKSSTLSYEPDERKDTYCGCWVVYLHTRDFRVLSKRNARTKASQYGRVNYSGKVYCATVPGGLLYVRREKPVGFWCGNSSRIGLDTRIAAGAMKGSDGRLYQRFIDARTGKPRMVAADDSGDMVITFARDMQQPTNKVRAMVKGKLGYVPKSAVDLVMASPQSLHTPGTNFSPGFSGAKGQRLLMGARMQSQALPLKSAEAPLVRSLDPETGKDINTALGERVGAVFSKVPGVVTKVDADGITVQGSDGKTHEYDLYNNYVLNQKTGIHNTPVVKPGDRVAPDQCLAKSNYTDAKGAVALGANVRVAYHMMEGLTHEDAVVISESAAKNKFSSEQIYSTRVEKGENTQPVGKAKFLAKYGSAFTSDQLKNVDDNGVVKPGTILRHGDPMILAMTDRAKAVKSAVNMKTPKSEFVDASEVWEHDAPGEVIDVREADGGFNVVTRTYTPARVGDKLAGAYGDKGVISRVVPDDEMLVAEDGKPLDVVLNPSGINTRGNPIQVIEATLGKIAARTGKTYTLPAFDDGSRAQKAWDELQAHGMSDTEVVVDPKTGKKIPEVFTGVRHLFKLHHLAESKFNARSQAGYTMDDTPAKGGSEGAKRLGWMESVGLISHGATEVLRDAHLHRGQRNDDYWSAIRKGVTPPSPRISKAYQKFEAMLQGAGVALRKSGTKTQVLPMTDHEVESLAEGREISVADTVDFETGDPVPGGLFDTALTGGATGRKWAKISLPAALPNPIMEEPIRNILGMTGKRFADVMAGRDDIDGVKGPKAIAQAMSKIDVDREIEAAKAYIKTGRRTLRDKAVKKLGVLQTMKKAGLTPADMLMSACPVMPPAMRPVARTEGLDVVDDANFLYKDLMEAATNFTKTKEAFGDAGEAGLEMYNAFKAVTGMGDPVGVKSQERGARGLLKRVFGSSPKFGTFQRKVIGVPVDQVGRAVVIPDPELDIDEIGMPADAVWKQFKQYIIRDMVRAGVPAMEAAKAWDKRDPRAAKSLDTVIKNRPIIVNRAPSLHKFNLTAHFVKPVAGKALRMPIPILPGHNADFDGDALNFHVPDSESAVQQAMEKMLPSAMLFSPKNFGVHMLPNQGFLAGLYVASRGKSKKLPKTFKTVNEVVAAYRRGEIDVDDAVSVAEA